MNFGCGFERVCWDSFGRMSRQFWEQFEMEKHGCREEFRMLEVSESTKLYSILFYHSFYCFSPCLSWNWSV